MWNVDKVLAKTLSCSGLYRRNDGALVQRQGGVNDHPELDAKLIRYADDFVLMCRPGRSRAMMERLKSMCKPSG